MTNATHTQSILPGRTMPTNFPASPCSWCGTTPTAVYDRDSRMSACDACAASWKAQVGGLVRRLEALPDEQQQAVAPLVTDAVGLLVAEALGAPTDASPAARQVVPILLGIVSAAKAAAPAPVVPNRFGGKCADCGVWVDAGAGRRERVDGAWVVRHLAGACPEASAPAPSAPVAATPLAATEAQRWLPSNGRKGKCLGCQQTVAAGAGIAVLNVPDGRGWSVLHHTCAQSTANDRTGLHGRLTNFGFRITTATGSDTRDHAVRLAVDFITGEGNGEQSTVFLRVCWGTAYGVEVHTGAPGNVHRTPVGAQRAVRIMDNLLAMSTEALAKAQADYGTKMGACGRCGSPLTDDTSRALGLGPECRKHH